jgi:transposase
MTTATESFAGWLAQAQVREDQLTPPQRGLLQGAFTFRQRCGPDYYSGRLLSHFLLHAGTGLKVAQIARLVGISRPTASRQQGTSSKQAIQTAQHRLAGRPYGTLLPRSAGPIAEFLLQHPDASRYDILDFIHRTWDVRVSRVALYRFLTKYGLQRLTPAPSAAASPAAALPAVRVAAVPPGQPVPEPAPPFSGRTPSTLGRSCCCPRP